MILNRGKQIINRLKEQGLKVAVVGGVYKGKEEIHDIDLLVKEKDSSKVLSILEKQNLDIPIELYIADEKMYPRLLKALRATTYENIQSRGMKGLRYKKMRIE